MTVHREILTQHSTFKRGGGEESLYSCTYNLAALLSINRPLSADRDKIPEGRTSTFILGLYRVQLRGYSPGVGLPGGEELPAGDALLLAPAQKTEQGSTQVEGHFQEQAQLAHTIYTIHNSGSVVEIMFYLDPDP